MERLTYRSSMGNAVSKGACSRVECDFDCDSCSIDTLVQHLCYYEDMIESGKMVEQKHGRWIKKQYVGYEPFYLCSVCEKIHDQEYNFCNNCGAKMDGEK